MYSCVADGEFTQTTNNNMIDIIIFNVLFPTYYYYQSSLPNYIKIFIFQLGGATGHIGDPSGRSTDRIALQKDIINHNIECIKKNLESVFENHKKYIWEDNESRLRPIR